jgi:heme exporter protein A
VGSIPAVRTIMSVLSADNLHLWRGELHVLRGLSLRIDPGACLQVTGANGVGKSSLLRALCGLLPLEQGLISWRGHDVRHDRPAYHRELAFLGHSTGLKGDLSASENLQFSAGLRRALDAGQIAAALERVGMAEQSTRLARQMSAGQQRRVALARVLLCDCALWILDEPTANLDGRGQGLFAQLLEEHLQAGGLALMATHQPLSTPGPRLNVMELS